MKRLVALLLNDARNIVREPMLAVILLGPILWTLVIRTFVPTASEYLLRDYQFDLRPYYPLAAGFHTMLVPMLLGTMAGFVLLDERDDKVMTTLVVTPLGKEGYILYRVFAPFVIGFVYTFCLFPLLGFVVLPWLHLLFVSLISALTAPFISLLLSALAGNKVEGLAVSKGMGLLMLAPVAGFFVQSDWRLIAGVVPFFWPVEAIADFTRGALLEFWIDIALGILVSLGVLSILVRRLERRIH